VPIFMFLTSSEQLLLVCAVVQCSCIAYAILKIGFSSPGKVEKNFIKSFGTLSHFDLLAKLSQCVKFGILTTNLNTFSLNCCTKCPICSRVTAPMDLATR